MVINYGSIYVYIDVSKDPSMKKFNGVYLISCDDGKIYRVSKKETLKMEVKADSKKINLNQNPQVSFSISTSPGCKFLWAKNISFVKSNNPEK